MKTTAYLRVSTDKQEEASQLEQIEKWCAATSSKIDAQFLDRASGAKPWQERQLAGLMQTAQAGDRIVVSEISRIARSTIGVLTFLQAAAAKGVQVVAIRSGIALDDSMQSRITVTILALCAEIERELLRERTKAALNARREKGLPFGRPRGSKSAKILEPKKADIYKLLKAKVSKRAIARIMGCAPGTLYEYLANNQPPQPQTTPNVEFRPLDAASSRPVEPGTMS